MKLNQFLTLLNHHGTRTRKYQEQRFFQVLEQFGYDSFQFQKAIQEYVAPAYRNGMRQLLTSSKLRKLFQNVRKITEKMVIKFSKNRCINPYDLRALVQTGNMDLLEEYQLKQDFPEQYEELERTAKQIRGLLSESRKKILQFQEVIQRAEKEYDESRLHLGDRNTEVASSEQLRNLCASNWVFVKQSKIQQIFKTVSNLGIDHEVSRQLVKESTHPKFEGDLMTILGSIKPKEPLKDFRAEIKKIYSYYLEQYFMKQEMIEDFPRMIKHYLREEQQQFEAIIENYGIDGESQLPKLKENLCSLIDHLDQQFRKYEVDKILKQSYSLIQQRYNLESPKTLPGGRKPSRQSANSQSQIQIQTFTMQIQEAVQNFPSNIGGSSEPQSNVNRQDQTLQQQCPRIQYFKKDSDGQNQINYQKIQVLVIYMSSVRAHQVQILINDYVRKQIKQLQYYGAFVTLIGFEIQKSNMDRCKLIVTEKTFFRTTDRQEILQLTPEGNTSVTLINRVQQNNARIKTIQNFALFESIYFIIRQIIKDHGYDQYFIFFWLKGLCALHIRNKAEIIENEQQFNRYKEFFAKLHISKILPEIHSKYLIYFLYSVFEENTEKLILDLGIFQKMSFKKRFMERPSTCYRKCQDIFKLYLKLAFRYVKKSASYSVPEEFNHIVRLCLQSLSIQQYFPLLMQAASEKPLLLSKMDDELKQLSKNENAFDVIQYCKLKIKYFSSLISNANDQQIIQFIIRIIEDLRQIYKQPNTLNSKEEITQKEIQELLLITSTKFNLITSFDFKKMAVLYRKCKELIQISKEKIYFLDVIRPRIQKNCDDILESNVTQMTIAILSYPVHRNMKTKLQWFYQTHQTPVQMINIIAANQISPQIKYNIQELMLNSLEHKEEVKYRELENIIFSINKLQKLQEYYQNIDFIKSFFDMVCSKIKIVNSKLYLALLQKQSFKDYLNLTFGIKYDQLKQIYIQNVINHLKTNIPHGQYVFHKIQQVYFSDDLQSEKRRQFWVKNYLQSYILDIYCFQKYICELFINNAVLSQTRVRQYARSFSKKIGIKNLPASRLNQIRDNIKLSRCLLQQFQEICHQNERMRI